MSTVQLFRQQSPPLKLLFLLGLFLLFLGFASAVQVGILAAFAGVNSFEEILLMADFSNPDVLRGMKWAQGVSAILTFIIPAFIFSWLSADRGIRSLEMHRPFTGSAAMITVMLVFAVMPLINKSGELNQNLHFPEFLSGVENWIRQSEENLKDLTEAFLKMEGPMDLIGNLIVIALLAAVGEELFFRGAMQNTILSWSRNPHIAVWSTAIFFSAIHMQFLGFIPRMLLGVILGYLYIWSRSLWLPILFHFLNNGLAVYFTYLISKGALPEETETIGAGDSPMYLALISILLSTGLMYLLFLNRERGSEEVVN